MMPFTADHPRNRAPPGVFSCEEIRYWIKELTTRYEWSATALASALGFHDKWAPQSLLCKIRARPAWIYPGEQIRISRGLERVLSGELVCRRTEIRGRRRVFAVVADHPVPLKRPPRWRYNLAALRLERVIGLPPRPSPALPSFRSVVGIPHRTWTAAKE